jgi:DNA-directed RNA polymerase specialized sigma24 family protein
LPPAQQEIFALLVDEYSQKEIADLLGKNPAAIRQTVSNARRTLRRNNSAAGVARLPMDEDPSSRDEA